MVKEGDFVDVHFPGGCLIGILHSDEGNTVTVKFDEIIVKGIPKAIVTLLFEV